jgi:hypothetical protein
LRRVRTIAVVSTVVRIVRSQPRARTGPDIGFRELALHGDTIPVRPFEQNVNGGGPGFAQAVDFVLELNPQRKIIKERRPIFGLEALEYVNTAKEMEIPENRLGEGL